MLGSIAIGMAGYAYFEGLSLAGRVLECVVSLGEWGLVESPATPMGKLFAGCYAALLRLVFLILAGIVLAPVLHRILHRFHWTDAKE